MVDSSKKPSEKSGAFCINGEQADLASKLQLRARRQRLLDRAFLLCTQFFAFLVLALLGGIVLSLFISAWPSIKAFGFNFLITCKWDSNSDQYGALVPIYGTLVSSIIALIIAVPISFGIAFFLTELCPNWLRRPLGIAIELLAGIPSIIYGMWGLFIFAPYFSAHMQPWLIKHGASWPIIGWIFKGQPIGLGLFTAGLVLAIMIIPFITSVMRDVFETVPSILKESAYGLGATTWEVIHRVVLPYTKTGVIGGIMLGLGRALGETMAVTFIIGNSNMFAAGLFQPGNSIASLIANEFSEADGLQLSALMELALILFFITFVVLACSKVLLHSLKRKEGMK